MKKTYLLFSLLLLITFTVLSQEQNFLEKAYLKTAATYTKEVMPDRIFLGILITENDSRGKVSVEELESKMIAKLKMLGIDISTQLQLTDLTSDFKKYFLKKDDILKNKMYSLLVYDAETAGMVIRELELISISNIELTGTEYSKLEELKIELKGKAVAKAKKQAEAMLMPLGQKVGKALYISDLRKDINDFFRRSITSGSNQLYDYSGSIIPSQEMQFDTIKVKVDVVVYFEIL